MLMIHKDKIMKNQRNKIKKLKQLKELIKFKEEQEGILLNQTKQLTEYEQKLEQSKKDYQIQQEKNQIQENKIEQLNNEYQLLFKEKESQSIQIQLLSQQIQELQQQNESNAYKSSQKIEEIINQLNLLQQTIEFQENEIKKLNLQNEDLQDQQLQFMQQLQAEKQAHNLQLSENHQLQEQLQQELENSEQLKVEIQRLEKELNQLKQTISDQDQSIIRLTDQCKRQEQMEKDDEESYNYIGQQQRESTNSVNNTKNDQNLKDETIEHSNLEAVNQSINQILPTVSENISETFDQAINTFIGLSKDQLILQLQKEYGGLQQQIENMKKKNIIDESPCNCKMIIEKLQQQIQQLNDKLQQRVLKQTLRDLIGEELDENDEINDEEKVYSLWEKCKGLELEIQMIQFDNNETQKKNESLKQENDSLQLQVNYLNKTVKVWQDTTTNIHQQYDQKQLTILSVLQQALNQEQQWGQQINSIKLNSEGESILRQVCSKVFEMNQAQCQIDSIKKQLEKEKLESKKLINENKILSQQITDIRVSSSRSNRVSEPNSALKINQSIDEDDCTKNIKQIILKYKKELEIIKIENNKLSQQLKESEQNEEIYMKQNKLMKDENRILNEKLIQSQDELQKMAEKVYNSENGALGEHLKQNIQKFFEALQQEKKQEFQFYASNLLKLSGAQQVNDQLIIKLSSVIDKKKSSGMFGIFN